VAGQRRLAWTMIKTRSISRPVAMIALGVSAPMVSSVVLPFGAEAQNGQDGQALFQKRCSGCHALDADHEGPRLRGVVGRAAGTVKTFQYSDALKNAKHVWDENNLNKWLTDPESVVPDNDMSFQVPKQEERAAIISYLKSLSTP
jgi:cytochrome c